MPGTYGDHPFTIGENDGNAAMTIEVSWDDPSGAQDWDAYLFRKGGDGELTQVASSATEANPEKITIPTPSPGDYVLRVNNFAAVVPYTAKVTFTPGANSSAAAGDYPSAAYVGFCGYCDVITQGTPFANGIATNVAGDKPGKTDSADGWHVAAANGLPNRYITSVRMDPANPKTVFVTLGGYGRRWAQPGALGDDTSRVGTGHVFRSDDAGETFRDISADLPDVPANWSVLHHGRLVVATDLGVFASCDADGGSFRKLGTDLPSSPVYTLRYKPGDADMLVGTAFGSGVWTYRFTGAEDIKCGDTGAAVGAAGTSCLASKAARAFAARPVKAARRVRFTIPKGRKAARVDIFQVSQGRRIFRERLVGRYRVKGTKLTWNGRAKIRGRRATDGFYFARVRRPGNAAVSRLVLRRRGSKWSAQPDFQLRSTCGVVKRAKFERPVFGGRQGYPLRYSYRLGKPATVGITVWKGKRAIRTYKPKRRSARQYRVTLDDAKLKKGRYRVTLDVRRGRSHVVATVVSRRL